ncbi:MAG TPA: serine/threonine-protein kinase, partial [Fibrobacteria bacterium]|nr:serine/threonine-protein kinase [Fibrobacteria bacterium]
MLYKLGQGAMARVFLARDPVLSRFVAVKVLHAELAARRDVLQRFFNEARTVAAVRSPHVVEVFDFGQEGKDLYLVMEFVDGLSLHGMLRQLRHDQGHPDRPEGSGASFREAPLYFDPLDATVAAALMCQAAEGLSVAARHGVVHRDVKPENLMINTQGYLKISDFGIAHVQDDSITKTGAVLGSPLFMSPEQARGLKPITSQADMFSLGGVFYSCLVGHPPFQGRNVTDLFRKIATEPHTPLWRLRPDLDPSLGNLIETLLRKDPAARGGGPRWLHRQLKGYLMASGVMDPAELIGAYLQELSSRGIQTTWRMDAPDPLHASTLPAGTLSGMKAATERHTRGYARESSRRVPAAALGAVLGVLGMAAGGALWGFLHLAGRGEPDRRAHLEPAGPEGNRQGTLVSFAPPRG